MQTLRGFKRLGAEGPYCFLVVQAHYQVVDADGVGESAQSGLRKLVVEVDVQLFALVPLPGLHVTVELLVTHR